MNCGYQDVRRWEVIRWPWKSTVEYFLPRFPPWRPSSPQWLSLDLFCWCRSKEFQGAFQAGKRGISVCTIATKIFFLTHLTLSNPLSILHHLCCQPTSSCERPVEWKCLAHIQEFFTPATQWHTVSEILCICTQKT